MATDLLADLTARIAVPIQMHLDALGADVQATLAPPTRAGSGDLAMACHPLARFFRKAPNVIAEELADVVASHPLVASVEPVSGFLNINLNWTSVAQETLKWGASDEGALGFSNALAGQRVLVEFSSPNTNKPQHLGHCRNNILGDTVSRVMATAGAEVVRVNLVNDRGIHICKSMVAYARFGNGETPESTGKKGDHFIGDYYVLFDQKFNAEYQAWSDTRTNPLSKDDYFNSVESDLGAEARAMLLAWEAGDHDVRGLWSTMNAWCEAGFKETYERMGVTFDRVYHESNTYLLGKDLISEGLENGVFHRATNGAAVFDLSKIGLDGEKAVLRADGTSVYVTQDIGTAMKRFEEYEFDKMIYVVGNEQEHHFKVLFGTFPMLCFF